MLNKNINRCKHYININCSIPWMRGYGQSAYNTSCTMLYSQDVTNEFYIHHNWNGKESLKGLLG